MPDPEINDLLKMLEKKYTRKPEGEAASGSAAGPAAGAPPSVPAPPAAAVPPPPRPPAAAAPPLPRPPAAAAPPAPSAAVPPTVASSAPDASAAASAPPPPTSAAPAADARRAAHPGAGMISSISIPRKAMAPAQGVRRPPPVVGGGFGVPTGIPSRFGAPAPAAGAPAAPAPSAFPAASAFSTGQPSAFGGSPAAASSAGPAHDPQTPVADPVAAVSSEPAQAHFGLVVKELRKPLNAVLREFDSINLVRAVRPRLGRDVSEWMFRAACFQGLLQSHGRDYVPWSLLAGRKFGQLVQIPDYASLDKAFRSLRIGGVTYQETPTHIVFDVHECMICHGIFGLDEPCCGFVGGLLGSVVSRVTERDVTVRETHCMVRHHDTCRFEVAYTRSVVVPES